jgi:hypothetical protein
MKTNMIDNRELSNEIRKIIINNARTWFYVYKKNKIIPSGVFLIKDKSNGKKYYFKPTKKKGKTEIIRHLNSKKKHWNQTIDKYIFIGSKFRDNTKAYTLDVNNNLIIIDIDNESSEIIIYGSMKINKMLLGLIQKLEHKYDYKVLTDIQKALG